MPRPKKDLQQLARAHTEAAIKTLVGIMNQPKATPSARVQAANAILDRGWGKAPQEINAEVSHRYVVEAPSDAPTTVDQWQKQHAPLPIQ